MKTILSYVILLIVILLQGCIQAPSNTRKNSLASSASAPSGSKTGTGNSPTFASDENLYWFTTVKTTGTVTINKNTQDIIYLRGKSVHDFLNSKDQFGSEFYRKQYCLVGNFLTPATYKQIRVRAIPIYVTTSTKAIERLLRVDIASNSDNTSACNNTAIDNIIPGNAAFSLPEICTSCSGLVTTSNLNLYESKTSPNSLTKIETTKINLSSALLRVDLQSNSTDSGSSCTNSQCENKGFDCCISGQCVKDASEKINASNDPQYLQAKIDYASNPLSFINYPNIFYICSNIAHTPPPSTTGPPPPTPINTAEARVKEYLEDYTCISDVTATASYLNCLSTITADNKKEAAYIAIKKKLAIRCGCTAIDSEMSLKCPDWGIVPVYRSGSVPSLSSIVDFQCYTPTPPNPIGPITNLNVSVPNRSAPHRFYSSDGVNYGDISGLKSKLPNLVQEGQDFYYLDEYNKAAPISGSFNINSIIGKMTIDLSNTVPAKEITVELGKTYILSATSGYFTPCTQCVKDNWFQTFSAYPTTQRGVGLQASGYTTSRDTYSANNTFGNYEDTKFGRACYVPVTMLPFAHQKNSNLQVQRQNRLKTQSAFYINGYQRDWYGFNKGALIGSFDGVTWFAVGTGRRATATSNKLYLAINAPFLDLADKTDTIVNIIPDFSANTAADYDFDPEIALMDPRQNAGATCQQYHQCATDADCVTQLGWEYACADVSQYKTKWPLYDHEAKETVNQEQTGSLFEILQNTINTTTGNRCVYRGAGAPCKRSYQSLSPYNQKLLTCAPNFYCAALNINKFNDELARSPNELDDILFGMDTNILGRPLNYVTASKSLTNEIISNIKYNATDAIKLSSVDADDMGICRPGRSLSSNPITAHSNPDTAKRSDYISQVGSCDSRATNAIRYVSCPVFDDALNYADPNHVDTTMLREAQNACGGESKHTTLTDTNNANISAFQFIESLSLLNTQSITQPTLVQDACFRRAGSVCHSDLDCGPNKLHEEAVSTTDIKYFGETEAEQQYWKESLICGQGKSVPAQGTPNYFDYYLTNNRCCREIGKDFTMYTQGPKSIVPENTGTNESLKTSQFPSTLGPSAKFRYSRYTISRKGKTDVTKIPAVTTSAEPNANQWDVINETGSLTCCGGGWIRKFADGTHDWKVRNRLTIDASNFSCLNFRSPLADSGYNNFTADKVVQASYQKESEFFCKYPDGTGCLQVPYQLTEALRILPPFPYEPSSPLNFSPDTNSTGAGYTASPPAGHTRLDTSPLEPPTDGGSNELLQYVNNDVPYSAQPFYFSPVPYDTHNGKAHSFFRNKTFDFGVEMYLPAYIGYDSTSPTNSTYISKVFIKYFYATGFPKVVDITANVATPANCAAVVDDDAGGFDQAAPITAIPVNHWCIINNANTQNRPVINVRADNVIDEPADWQYAGVVIDFKPIENVKGTRTSAPGNAMYYLSKLAKLELIGIPQITYEPLYCNNNQENLVPGIFKTTATNPLTTRTHFVAPSVSTTYSGLDPILRYHEEGTLSGVDSTAGYGNVEKRFTYQHKLDHPAIFSSKDFTCCTPMGKTTTSATKCCSGFAVAGTDGTTLTCKLPRGTDLHVYFNKFVSSEGVGEEYPDGGLITNGTDAENDFNKYTGEPKYRDSTNNKISALGALYCNGGTVETGGAFGAFPPEPFSGSYYELPGSTGTLEDLFPMSIVDSVLDFQQSDLNLGKIPFDTGFRWNHHFYCK